MNDATITLNQSQCFKTVSHIGWDQIYNLCNGTNQSIPWGFADWMILALVCAILTIIIFGFGAVLYAMFAD